MHNFFSLSLFPFLSNNPQDKKGPLTVWTQQESLDALILNPGEKLPRPMKDQMVSGSKYSFAC